MFWLVVCFRHLRSIRFGDERQDWNSEGHRQVCVSGGTIKFGVRGARHTAQAPNAKRIPPV